MKNIIGRVVGLAVFVAAAAAIWMWPKGGKTIVAEEVVRPVRSYVAKAGYSYPDLQFPGVVKAGATRALAFEVAGRLKKLCVTKAQLVKKGDVIARLDPENFEDALAKAKAVLERDQLTLKRMSAAAKRNAISAEELSAAEAKVKTDEAECAIAERALENTTLLAPFDGLIADTYPDDLDMLSVGQKVVTLMNTDSIEVEVSMPETLIIRSGQIEASSNSCSVVFDSCPRRSYNVKLLKFTTIADPRTQVYKVNFTMPQVDELVLLPGMSATVTLKAGHYTFKDSAETASRIAIPSSAVGVAADGSYFVWKLKIADAAKGTFTAHRGVFKPGCRIDATMVALEGIAVGERIVTAGVSQLSEGSTVTLLKERK